MRTVIVAGLLVLAAACGDRGGEGDGGADPVPVCEMPGPVLVPVCPHDDHVAVCGEVEWTYDEDGGVTGFRGSGATCFPDGGLGCSDIGAMNPRCATPGD